MSLFPDLQPASDPIALISRLSKVISDGVPQPAAFDFRVELRREQEHAGELPVQRVDLPGRGPEAVLQHHGDQLRDAGRRTLATEPKVKKINIASKISWRLSLIT